MKYAHRIYLTIVWLFVTAMASYHALKQNWGAAIFFLIWTVLLELAEVNGRLRAIQNKEASR